MVAISAEGTSLALTPAQVAQVIDASGGEPLLLSIRALIASPLLEDPKISKSLLLGLLILVSFPSDGGKCGNKQIAQEMGLAASTTHRYIHTLVAAGLLEQDEVTRKYRRPSEIAALQRGRGRE
jgi:DNA-binding MarR family transcriptional regulator